MTIEEMIAWARFPSNLDVMEHCEAQKRLIWIARLQGRRDAFQQMAAFANQLDDIEKKMDAIQEPEKGLYARVKDLEAWQAITSKVLWGLGASVGSIIMMYVGHKFGVN